MSIFSISSAPALLISLWAMIFGVAGEVPADFPKEFEHILKSDLDKWKPPEEITKGFVYYLSGVDDESRPIWVMEMGKWDFTILDKGPEFEQALDKYLDQMSFNFFQSSTRYSLSENQLSDLVLIIDLGGYDQRRINIAKTINFLLKKIPMWVLGLKYTNAVYVLNTNYFTERAVNLLRPAFGAAFAQLNFYGSNSKSWIPKLLKNIPQDQLPEWYGGAKGFKPLEVHG